MLFDAMQSADICDASRGSLSSYAYILVVIYFLQQRKPPVIPVLQEASSVGFNIDIFRLIIKDFTVMG
jgi:DNA polymerase sigma